MKKQAGIWIDKQHAILIKISDERQEISKFEVDEIGPASVTADSNHSSSSHHHDYQPEDRIERKKCAERKEMYTLMLKALHDTDSLLLLGPGEAKKEFAKHISAKRFPQLHLEMEISDKMTVPQFAARVREHFAAR